MENFSDLPQVAQLRLQQMRRTAGKPGIFTCNLSVNEFLLLKQAGFEPLGLVMGSSIYQVGCCIVLPDVELDEVTQATYTARRLAMTRMIKEAKALGADGIIGVRLQFPPYKAEEVLLLDVVVFGTAIRHTMGKNFQGPCNNPFISNLSAKDFWTLLQSGYRPYSIVMGNCVFAVRQQGLIQQIKQTGKNQEVEIYTQKLYQVRELAQNRMVAEMRNIQAHGVVGVQLQEVVLPSPGREGAPLFYLLDYFSIGTAIVPMEEPESMQPPVLVQPMTSENRDRTG
jgi:uncharacterized protein YbjQ (UPF0145 family)